jgi:hypothetical protein
MDELCEWWVTEICAARKKFPKEVRTPGALYKGISFDTVVEIAQEIGHENVLVVNRGAGLVRFTDKMIPYNFTYDKESPESAKYKVVGEKFMPTLWWGKVNLALYGNASPISSIKTLDGEEYDYFITSLSEDFISLISADLTQISSKDSRLFMPLQRSRVNSVPRSIRSNCVPYTPAYTNDLNYSRYNKAHKVTQKFMSLSLVDGNVAQHANALRDAALAFGSVDDEPPMSYPEMFAQNPDLLEAPTADVAMSRARLKGLRPGSQTKFVGAWRGAKGQIQVDAPKDVVKRARTSLLAVIEGMKANEPRDNEELLKQIGVFLMAVREECPSLLFTPKDIAAWGKLTYGEQASKKHSIGSNARVSSMLRSHTAFLGIKSLNVTGASIYQLIPEGDAE